MTKFTQILAGVASVALLATAAHAGGAVTIKTADLDLSTPAGQKELDKRAEAAAKTLCRGTYMAQTNCVPGAKAKLIEKAKSGGTVTVGENGRMNVSMAAN